METIYAKQLIHKVNTDYSWFSITHNCNIYKGCNHGCIYCDSRSSCYHIPNFDEVKVKKDADKMIEVELQSKRQKGILGLGGMNDPYNPFEAELLYTRSALHSVHKHGFGLVIITKSTLVLRDIDLLQSIARHSPVTVIITITTAEDRLQGRIERNVMSSSERFKAIQTLREHGIYAGIMMAPILPFINDTVDNIRDMVTKAKQHKAAFIYPMFSVTLRDNQRQYFFQKIGPTLREKYIETYQDSYLCRSLHEKALYKEFKQLCSKEMILYEMNDIIEETKSYQKVKQVVLF